MGTKQYFKLTSETHLGLIHHVTAQETIASGTSSSSGISKPKKITTLECSCEARSYSNRNICKHILSVRLGEAPLPAPKPEVDAVVGVIKGLEIIVLRDLHNMSVHTFVPPENANTTNIASSHITPAADTRAALFETINRRGYCSVGLFFDPLGTNPPQQIKDKKYKFLRQYIDRVTENIITGTALSRYGTIGLQDLANFLHNFIYNSPREPGEDKITAAEIIRETTLEALANMKNLSEFEKTAREKTKAACLKKKYLKRQQYREDAIIDLEEECKRRETKKLNFEAIQNSSLFGIHSKSVERNTRAGYFMRAFFTECYASIGQEIPEELYCLPAHKLEEMYKMVTGAKIVRTR